MIRSLLRGSFQNTAFTIFAPDGKTQLAESGRSPSQVFERSKGDGSLESVLESMREIAENYELRGKVADAVLPDFHSFGQALNVSSADQRLLVYTVLSQAEGQVVPSSLQHLASTTEFQGVFHYDTAGERDKGWRDLIEGAKAESGIFVIQAEQFGQKGRLLAQLPLHVITEELLATAKQLNATYSENEPRKIYREHVSEGQQKGIQYANAIPHGEDRDGDGLIDPTRRKRR